MENIVGKGETAHFEQFYLFPQCFPKAFFFNVLKRVYMEVRVRNILGLVLQILLHLEAFECNTTSDWLNHMV